MKGIDRVFAEVKKTEYLLGRRLGRKTNKWEKGILNLYYEFYGKYIKYLKYLKYCRDNMVRKSKRAKKIIQEIDSFLAYLNNVDKEGNRELTQDEMKKFKSIIRKQLKREREQYNQELMFIEFHKKLYNFVAGLCLVKPAIDIVI
ncbi:MAG: hypothetical protein NT033_03335 [Candidatus Omnitrophica bacterium]|nr:hypothetical protein [Candidatus Omnitrophota bacterium]